MDAIEFIKERQRLCQTYVDCFKCPAYNSNTGGCNFNTASGYEATEQIRLLEGWSAAHPCKTRQDVFLEQYPDVSLSYGIINIKPCQIVRNHTYGECCITDCPQCRKEFWTQEVQ